MKIAITGVGGLLGSTLHQNLSQNSIDVLKLNRDCVTAMAIDSLCQYFSSQNISVLIHCAANTNVEVCEEDRLACYRDNIVLTEKLASACKINLIKFVFISSTGIYGNHQDLPYCEYDDVIPTTVHHKSKYIAEKRLAEVLDDLLIIRTGWLFGGEWNMSKNFVANRIKEAMRFNGSIHSDISQKGNPTFVGDVSDKIYELIKLNQTGTFNCVNEGVATRFEYVREVIRLSGLDVAVLPVDGTNFKRKASVSHNESAINFKLSEFGLGEMPYWKHSLATYINTIRLEYEKN